MIHPGEQNHIFGHILIYHLLVDLYFKILKVTIVLVCSILESKIKKKVKSIEIRCKNIKAVLQENA